MNRSLRPIVALSLVIVIILLGVAMMTQQQSAMPEGGLNIPAPLSPQSASVVPSPSRTPTLSLDTGEWKLHTDSTVGFSMKYPEHIDIKNSEQNSVQFLYVGSTQQENTEWHDGINILIRSGSLNGQTLQLHANAQVAEAKATGVSEITQDLTPITIAGKSGYTYDVRGMGERTVILLPKSNDEYIEITDSTVDPENRGYRTIVDTMLESLTIIP